jgi:hypothetical protein
VLQLFDTKRGIYIGVGKAVNSATMSNKVAKCTGRKVTVVNKMRDRHERAIACLMYDTRESTRGS